MKLGKKIRAHLESLEFWKNFDVCLNKFKNNQILIIEICHRYQATTRPFTG